MSGKDKGPRGIFTGEQVRKLLAEHPELPIVFRIYTETLCGEWRYEFMSSAYAEIGEILDCCQNVEEELIFIDREEFKERVEDNLPYGLTTDEMEAEITATLAEYEPYWKKCIIVTVGN